MVIVSERDGAKAVPVVKGCYPTMHHCLPNCERRPNNIYFFPDSKYQTKVDIGKCVGGCNGEEIGCLSMTGGGFEKGVFAYCCCANMSCCGNTSLKAICGCLGIIVGSGMRF